MDASYVCREILRSGDMDLLIPYHDRYQAGRILAGKLRAFQDPADLLVLALPRGGVPVAFEVAQSLHAPLDVLVVRKLGVPGEEELAFGAIASGGVRVVNEGLVRRMRLTEGMISRIEAREKSELDRREQAYRGGRPAPQVRGRTVILIDDGLATGATMMAAVRALRPQDPQEIIVAVPVASREVCDMLRREADHIVCPATPKPFYGVGRWYENFSETTDDEVRDLLEQAARKPVS
jgi:putative phosphoribosyl transferase